MNNQLQAKTVFFLYARKSSESEDRQVQSIDDQIARLKELASTLGIVIKEIFIEAKSAKKPHNRPVFTEMLKRIEKGEANGILVWHLNRLSRNPIDSGTIGWMLQQGVIQSIQTVERQHLPGDNVLLFSIESGMANQYIIELRKACMRGMDRKAELGWKPGMAPIGYVNHTDDRDNNTITPDPERFALVRQMWDMMLTGNYTPKQICQKANNEWGFRTPTHRTKGGKELSVTLTYVLFGNIFYTGMFEWKGVLYKGNHTPMITLAEFDRVQQLVGRKGAPRYQHHDFAYTGLMHCHTCKLNYTASEKMKFVKATGMYRPYVYYHCTRKRKTIACDNPPIKLAALEFQIERELERYTIAPEFLDWALAHLDKEKGKTKNDTENNRAIIEKALRLSEKELENLTRMRYRELIDDASFIKERDAVRNNITKLMAQLNEQTDNSDKWIELAQKAFQFAAYAHNNFVHGTSETRRKIVSSFGSNYCINDKKLLFEASVWLIPIQNDYPKLYAEFKRLELQKHLDTEAWNAFLAPVIQQWCTLVEEVRTALETNTVTDFDIPLLQKIDKKDSGP